MIFRFRKFQPVSENELPKHISTHTHKKKKISHSFHTQHIKPHFLPFQIHSLEFDPNGEITALVSSEKEIVPLTKKINPTAANVRIDCWKIYVFVHMLHLTWFTIKTKATLNYSNSQPMPNIHYIRFSLFFSALFFPPLPLLVSSRSTRKKQALHLLMCIGQALPYHIDTNTHPKPHTFLSLPKEIDETAVAK